MAPPMLDDGRAARERAPSTALRGCPIDRALGGRRTVTGTPPARTFAQDRGGREAYGARRFAARLQSPHDVVWTKGTQFDFYDDPATAAFSAERAVEHLGRTLV